MLHPGLYEQVINRRIKNELSDIPEICKAIDSIDKAEASRVLTQYIADIIQKGLDYLQNKHGNILTQVSLANKIIDLIKAETEEAEFTALSVDERAEQLLALLQDKDPELILNKSANKLIRPETSIAQSSLFTGAVHEPQMFSELKKEIDSADQIDMLVSFIKWSGLRLIIDELKRFTQRGGRLRVITTSYMGATDIKAIEALSQLNQTEIKVSYDTRRTRLHAKTYVFYRNTGFTTAYVGSSNLSHAAISSGLEWNIKVTAKDLADTIRKITATFDSYWHASEFECYSDDMYHRLQLALKSERGIGSSTQQTFFFDIHPYPYQQEILDMLNAERKIRQHHRNLVVAATGTGKTVIAAFDYLRFCRASPGSTNRLLFIAHREEILIQSRQVFQAVLKDANFGDLFVGNYKPQNTDHLFVSVQTINSQNLCGKLSATAYDFIVIDEFHHAAAPTYQELLSYFKPDILLGLTATPERMDGKDILEYFDGRIAAEIRLPEAIDRKLLCPFQYFGVTDTVDLNTLQWARGGYDKSELTHLYSMNHEIARKRAGHIIRSVYKYVTDIMDVKGLGFCVSVEHAQFMADFFNDNQIPSISLVAQSDDETRKSAKQRLLAGELRFIFVVDLYNEGVDIPEVNTVLFLRPTESLTVFLQQLGRGLRLSDGKDCLTVLDFIGQANKKYNFEEKFAALLTSNKHSVQYELNHGFLSMPRGSYIQLEKKAAQHIISNIRSAFSAKAGLVSRAATFEADSGLPLTLANFIDYHHLDIRTVYTKSSFARISVLAGVKKSFSEPAEKILTKAFKRLTAINSRRWIEFLLSMLPRINNFELSRLSALEKRMFQMFYVTVWQTTIKDWQQSEVHENIANLAKSPVMLAEMIDILAYRHDHIDFIDEPVDVGFACPLDLYCNYTRDQLLSAMDIEKPGNIREGVKWVPDKQIDVLLVTLNKSDKDYSPSTMYNDYSISETLFHWQSQSTTSEHASTGQRYIHHRKRGSKVLLFVREYKKDLAGAAPYTFLGLAHYVKHDGSRPMNIIWQLERPIPARYLRKTNQMVVG